MHGVVKNVERELVALRVVASNAWLRIYAVFALTRVAKIVVAAIAGHHIRYLPPIRLHDSRVPLVEMRVTGNHDIGPDFCSHASGINLREHCRARRMRFADSERRMMHRDYQSNGSGPFLRALRRRCHQLALQKLQLRRSRGRIADDSRALART